MTETGGGRLHIPIHLRWGDLDAFNHVNNATMLKLLEEARVRAFWLPHAGETAPSTAVLDSGLHSGVLTLIARQEIEYLAPVPYRREPLDVQIWFGRLGGSSIDVCYEVCGPITDPEPQVFARATTVVVKVDAASGRPMRLSTDERSAWEPFLGDPISFGHRR
ncbi:MULTISPECIES: thioesterase family protein [unclassified Microbacterium]|uniref:acyl-CoA thioesterase n=1 Tax=unclassified Microbacterium TaxID=2609290 RepID=UPI000C4C6F24|nr:MULTISPECIES: thioesterase family protein [unclassified Microbacterium]MAY48404.1 4-hydroxybenzoyl-CoA thioesterase [Microbacterium sp.]HBR88006.1 4-hydroxybenzoyl-CoA thioesterase [Microbacterium sp.]HBS73007.1 4-hydroxybenzoyl-CoA thioesterase [Microbacterium sp.]